MRVLVAGASGFVGTALVRRLSMDGHQVMKLVRHEPSNEDELGWQPLPDGVRMDPDKIEGFDAVVHLGGVSIGEQRWTPRHKERLWNSRVVTTDALARAITMISHKPKVFVCASATGYYGSRGDDKLMESSSQGRGFLAELCARWEEMARIAEQGGVRVVNLRSGLVLGHGGGVLKRQIPMFRMLLGGRYGDGSQWMSWISLRDEVDAIVHLINSEVEGPVNLTSPNPVKNIEWTKTLGNLLTRPTIFPAPRWSMVIPLGAEATDEALLASQRCVPTKLPNSGFRFADNKLESAIEWTLEQEEVARLEKRARKANQ